MLCQGKMVMHIFEQPHCRVIGYSGQKRDSFFLSPLRFEQKIDSGDRGRVSGLKHMVSLLQYFQYLSTALDFPWRDFGT
jgi:hypothetical protein